MPDYEDTKQRMIDMISHVDDLDMIMYNSYVGMSRYDVSLLSHERNG